MTCSFPSELTHLHAILELTSLKNPAKKILLCVCLYRGACDGGCELRISGGRQRSGPELGPDLRLPRPPGVPQCVSLPLHHQVPGRCAPSKLYKHCHDGPSGPIRGFHAAKIFRGSCPDHKQQHQTKRKMLASIDTHHVCCWDRLFNSKVPLGGKPFSQPYVYMCPRVLPGSDIRPLHFARPETLLGLMTEKLG